MKKIISIILVSLILNSCFLVSDDNKSDFPFQNNKDLKFKELKNKDIYESISLSVNWFKSIQKEDGRLVYQINPVDNIVSNDENFVRQAGTFFAITEFYKRDLSNKFDLDSLIRNYALFFKNNSLNSSYKSKSFSCVADENGVCSIGTTALSMIALINYSSRNTQFYDDYRELIESFNDYLLAMRIENAGFIAKFTPNKNPELVESSFYNGEAFLALAKYYNFTLNNDVLNEIFDLWPYLRESYINSLDSNFYLWGMLALKELKYLIPVEDFLPFVSLYTKARVKSFERYRNNDQAFCGFLEGLSASVYLFKFVNDKDLFTLYNRELSFWLQKIDKLQIKTDEIFDFKIKNLRNSLGAFIVSSEDPTIRIDYTQHCLNGYLIKFVDIDENSI